MGRFLLAKFDGYNQQIAFDQYFQPDKYVFINQGPNEIHLTGYYEVQEHAAPEANAVEVPANKRITEEAESAKEAPPAKKAKKDAPAANKENAVKENAAPAQQAAKKP